MPVRKIKKSYISCVGYFKSFKNNKQLAFESILERDFFMLLEFDNDVVSFEEQPLKITYKLRAKNARYTPDVLVRYKDGSKKIFEVKYQSDIDSDPKLQHKISVLKEEIAQQMSLSFETFTDSQIDSVYLKNCIFLYKHAFLSESPAISPRIEENINELSAPLSIKSFLEHFSTNQTEQLQVLPYFWHRIFKEPSLLNMHAKITMSSHIHKKKINE